MKKRKLILLPLLSLICSSCSGGEILLKDVYKDYFSIGAAVNEINRENELMKHFNSITCENAMKWASVHPADDKYTFEEADEYIKIAQKNNAKIRGHALVWHESIPETVFKNAGEYYSKEEILKKEKEHIKEVMTHFGDKVYCWDVVNEVIDDNQTDVKEDLSNVYRQSDWYITCGEDFIFTAFETAYDVRKELGIDVALFYNDYSNDTPYKLAKTLVMLKRIQEYGNKVGKKIIDGVGLQSHYHMGTLDIDQLENAIIEYNKLGLDIHITEFDINIYNEQDPKASDAKYYYNTYGDVPQNVIDAQTTMYNRSFQVFRKHKEKISNVTFWGVSDAYTYMDKIEPHKGRKNYPYIFDVYDEPKDAFYAITEF